MANSFEEAIAERGYYEAPERRLTREEVSAEARRIAETEGIKYKSARRRIERRRTTATQSRGQPNRAFARRVRQRGLHVSAKVLIDPSPGRDGPNCRERELFDIDLSGRQLEGAAAALDRGDVGAAEGEFWQAVFRAYEEVDDDEISFLAGAYICEIVDLQITWGGGGEE